MKKRVAAARDALIALRKKRHDVFNKTKVKDHGFREGDIIFTTNFSLPPPGVNGKFWPRLNKSPFQVVSVGAVTLIARRLVDNYTIQIRTDYCRKYVPHDPECQLLPDEVKEIVGKPLTIESLIELAKIDELQIVMTDRSLMEVKPSEPVRTRAQAQLLADRENLPEIPEILVDYQDRPDLQLSLLSNEPQQAEDVNDIDQAEERLGAVQEHEASNEAPPEKRVRFNLPVRFKI